MLEALVKSLDERLREGSDPLLEFKEDLMKQMIIIVGAPASGKSWFIKHSFGKWAKGATLGKSFPGVLGLHTTATLESDNSLRRIQHQAAEVDYKYLSTAKSEQEFDRILKKKRFSYVLDDGVRRLSDVLTWEQFQEMKSFGQFFGAKGNPVNSYYASMRGRGPKGEALKRIAREVFVDRATTAIKKQANVIIVDSAGEDITRTPFERFLGLAQEEGYSPSLVQLYLPLSVSIARNAIRGQKGRAVPAAQIKAAFNAMEATVKRLRADLRLDRYVKYGWKATGSGPFDGQYQVVVDDRMALKRRIQQMKAQGKIQKRLAADVDSMEQKLLAILEEVD